MAAFSIETHFFMPRIALDVQDGYCDLGGETLPSTCTATPSFRVRARLQSRPSTRSVILSGTDLERWTSPPAIFAFAFLSFSCFAPKQTKHEALHLSLASSLSSRLRPLKPCLLQEKKKKSLGQFRYSSLHRSVAAPSTIKRQGSYDCHLLKDGVNISRFGTRNVYSSCPRYLFP